MNKRVDKKIVILVVAAACVLAAALAAVLFLSRPGGKEPTGTTGSTPKIPQASYERWLAAHEYLLVYLLYQPSGEPEIYLTGETELANKSQSGGVYIRLTLEDGVVLLESKPLAAERTEKGTRDVSAPMIGYATFDEVDPQSVDLSGMEKLEFSQLKELTDAALLPALSEH